MGASGVAELQIEIAAPTLPAASVDAFRADAEAIWRVYAKVNR